MKKLLLLASVLAAFTVSSAFAEGSCPGSGGCGGGDKDKEDAKETEKQSLSVRIDL
jgi:hypothetical protein